MITAEHLLTFLLAPILLASVNGLPVNEAEVLNRNNFGSYADAFLGDAGYDRHSEVAPHYNVAEGGVPAPLRFPPQLMNTLLWRMSFNEDDSSCPEEQPILVSVNGLNGKFFICLTVPEVSHMRNRRGIETSPFSSETKINELKSNSANRKRSRLSINGAMTSLAGMLQSNARRHGGGGDTDLLLKKILSIG